MKATGIVRRIDDLGRVVIPKEIRRTLRIREGDPLEIFVDRDGEVILKKYSPIGELSEFAKEYVESLADATGHTCIISDRDQIIAVAGGSKKDYLGKNIGSALEQIIQDRRALSIPDTATNPFYKNDLNPDNALIATLKSQIVAPIIAEGDPIGAVILGSKEGAKLGELELKLAQTAAGFLAKQMEQ